MERNVLDDDAKHTETKRAMKKAMRVPLISLSLFFLAQQIAARQTTAPTTERTHWWWKESTQHHPYKSADPRKLPLILVKGNRFVDPQGKSVLFRGFSIADPDKLDGQGHWKKELFLKVKELGASVVRIPVHPVAWRERRPDQYLLLLDEAVDWCTEADLHIIIDWHSIGNLKTELFQNPMYNTSMTETLEFWRAVAQRYAGNTTVAFYEIFNEPATIYNRLGPMTWDEWKKINEEIIALIRAYDKETIPLVAGFDWAYDLTPLRINPVAAEGIGYVTHPYPDKRPKPWEPKWEEDFGFAADYFPVIATEFGFVLGKQGLADNREYGDRIIDYLEGRGISWVAWIFDPDWTPRLIESLDTTKLTESGEFFRQALRRKAKK
jgi:endoglucanase